MKKKIIALCVATALLSPSAAVAVDVGGLTPSYIGKSVGNCKAGNWKFLTWLPCWGI